MLKGCKLLLSKKKNPGRREAIAGDRNHCFIGCRGGLHPTENGTASSSIPHFLGSLWNHRHAFQRTKFWNRKWEVSLVTNEEEARRRVHVDVIHRTVAKTWEIPRGFTSLFCPDCHGPNSSWDFFWNPHMLTTQLGSVFACVLLLHHTRLFSHNRLEEWRQLKMSRVHNWVI